MRLCCCHGEFTLFICSCIMALARNILQKWHCSNYLGEFVNLLGYWFLNLDLPYLGKMESFNPYGRRNLTMYLVPGLCLVARLSSSMRTEHMTLLVLRCLSLCTGRKVHDISYALVSEITKKNMRHCDRLAILLTTTTTTT